ncbi:MAG: dockerin type I domain-containing protein [Nitrososphaerota archaeon]
MRSLVCLIIFLLFLVFTLENNIIVYAAVVKSSLDIKGTVFQNLTRQYSTTHFTIRYTTDPGEDAVLDDRPGDVPSYILNLADALEYAWDTLVNNFGYDPPLLIGKMDVFVHNVRSYALPRLWPGNPSINPVIHIGNDEEERLLEVAAHELYHTFQFDYIGDPYIQNFFGALEYIWFYEGTAEWMGCEVYLTRYPNGDKDNDGILDDPLRVFIGCVNDVLIQPHVNLRVNRDPDRYKNALYWYFLTHNRKIDFAPSIPRKIDLVRKIWEFMKAQRQAGLPLPLPEIAINAVLLLSSHHTFSSSFHLMTKANFLKTDFYPNLLANNFLDVEITYTGHFTGDALRIETGSQIPPLEKTSAIYIEILPDIERAELLRIMFSPKGLRGALSDFKVFLLQYMKNGEVIEDEIILGTLSKKGVTTIWNFDKTNVEKLIIIVSRGDDLMGSGEFEIVLEPAGFKVAVSPTGYDEIQKVLDSLGISYTQLAWDDLLKTSKIQEYSNLFINCAIYVKDPPTTLVESIKKYVEEGGYIYASDFAGGIIEKAFPGKIQFSKDGPVGIYPATITDKDLADEIGAKEINLDYDLPYWWIIQSTAPDVEVLVRTSNFGPAVIRFRYGKGEVVYTNFHNAEQGEFASKLLVYLTKLVTFKPLEEFIEEAYVKSDGFNLLAVRRDFVSQGQVKEYIIPIEKASRLRLVLDWVGSNLTLIIRDPIGTLISPTYLGADIVIDKPTIITINSPLEGNWRVGVKGEVVEGKEPFVLITGFQPEKSGNIEISVVPKIARVKVGKRVEFQITMHSKLNFPDTVIIALTRLAGKNYTAFVLTPQVAELNLLPNQSITFIFSILTSRSVKPGTYDFEIQVTSVSWNRSWNTTVQLVVEPLLMGDINSDGVVDYKDLAILISKYGSKKGDSRYSEDADLNEDGEIDYKDLAILISNYGKTA